MTPPRLWTAPQRRVILILLSLVLIYAVARRLIDRQYVSDPQPLSPTHADELQDRMDPNTADLATFAALPQIGLKRAGDIVAYREQFVATHPGQLAFRSSADLYRIRGFGSAMVALIEPYLIFPKPTTQP